MDDPLDPLQAMKEGEMFLHIEKVLKEINEDFVCGVHHEITGREETKTEISYQSGRNFAKVAIKDRLGVEQLIWMLNGYLDTYNDQHKDTPADRVHLMKVWLLLFDSETIPV